MTERVLNIGSWRIHFYFSEGDYDQESILEEMYGLGAAESEISRAGRIMDRGLWNRGFTYPNRFEKRIMVVIGPTTSGKQFLNTLTHEVRHVADIIAESMGYHIGTEGPAYITGDAVMALAETICRLGCPCHDR